MYKGPLEDTLEMLQRQRLIAQLDLGAVELSAEQSVIVDTLCGVLPMEDSPTLLQLVPEGQRDAITRLLARLPQTRVIERIVEGHWPQ